MPLPVPFEKSSASVFRRDHDHDGSGRRDRSYSDAHAILFSKTSSANYHSPHLDPASSTSTVMTSVEAPARDNNITMTETETGQVEANFKLKQLVGGSGGGKLNPSSSSSSHHHHHPQQHGHAAAGRPRSKSLDVHRHHVALPAMHKKKYPNHHHHHNVILRAHHGAQQYLLHHGRNSPETASTTTMKLKGKMWIRPASPIPLFKDHRRQQQQQQQQPHHEHGMEDNEAEQAIISNDNMMFSSPIYHNHREREPFMTPARRVADFPYSSTDPTNTTAVNSFDDEILMYSTTTTSTTALPKISFTSSSSSSTSPYGDVDFYPTAHTTATTRKEDTTRHDSRSDGNGGQLKFSFGESGKLIKPREIPLISTMRS